MSSVDAPAVAIRMAVPRDRLGILAIDRSFVTNRVYQLRRIALGFALEEVVVAPPISKDFPLDDDLSGYRELVGDAGGVIVGYAAYAHREWNRRTELWHLWVMPEMRGRGIGRRLVDAVIEAARHARTHCVWLETSNLAWPAIQFYRRIGFQLSGLDTALYDPEGPAGGEVALFFALPLDDLARQAQPEEHERAGG